MLGVSSRPTLRRSWPQCFYVTLTSRAHYKSTEGPGASRRLQSNKTVICRTPVEEERDILRNVRISSFGKGTRHSYRAKQTIAGESEAAEDQATQPDAEAATKSTRKKGLIKRKKKKSIAKPAKEDLKKDEDKEEISKVSNLSSNVSSPSATDEPSADGKIPPDGRPKRKLAAQTKVAAKKSTAKAKQQVNETKLREAKKATDDIAEIDDEKPVPASQTKGSVKPTIRKKKALPDTSSPEDGAPQIRRCLSTERRLSKSKIRIRRIVARDRQRVKTHPVWRGNSSPRAKGRSRGAKSKLSESLSPSRLKSKLGDCDFQTIGSQDLHFTPLEQSQPPVPRLSYGLERVLFNPGVYQLRDPRSRVFNFDPYLYQIMPINKFDFAALTEYITASRDKSLINLAKSEDKKYIGSTSSTTSVLSHFHYLLSQWRPINTDMLSSGFKVQSTKFTAFQRSPTAIFLMHNKDEPYAIDADKEYDNATVLSMLGKSMEKLLTLPTDQFERYRKSNTSPIDEAEQHKPESYHYTTSGKFLLRSQLDAYAPQLPGTGTFDLKTRAVVSVRANADAYEDGLGYEIRSRFGWWESFEREYYDLIRSGFLKYSLQVRMGRMDGAFVAYHNIERIFGFQYVSLPEMDQALHGSHDTALGDTEFKLSLELLERVLDRATKKFPDTSIRIHFETKSTNPPVMYIYAQPVTEEEVASIQATSRAKVDKFESDILGIKHDKTEGDPATNSQDRGIDEISVDDTVDIREDQVSITASEDISLKDAVTESEATTEPPNGLSLAEAVGGTTVEEAINDTSGAATASQPIADANQGELLAMILTISNSVNGKKVVRPTKFNQADDWTVEYALGEISDRDRAWKSFNQALRRRKAFNIKEDSEVRLSTNQYYKNLKSMTEKGREWRAAQDELDRETPPEILDVSSGGA